VTPVPPAQTMRSAGQPVDKDAGADAFRRAMAGLEAGLAVQRRARPELAFEHEPPPRRLAPYAAALAATVTSPGTAGSVSTAHAADAADAEIGGGRFVLLYDPAGQPGWDGKYRIIGYVRAELEPEMAADPLINAVGWSWLTEALDARSAGYLKISGTVTTVVTQGFGGKRDEPTSNDFELRASWSPAVEAGHDPDLDGHVIAWCEVICAASGLPPLAPGVAALRPQRRRRRQ
jgi:hypothetical protein